MVDAKLFCGNSNRPLAEKIAAELGVELGNINVKKFADGEILVKIEETVRKKDVFLIQPTCRSADHSVNDSLMELLIMADACRRASARSISAVVPYFGYARQERRATPREPITAKLAANLIETAGINRMLTMDLHALAIEGFFNIPVDSFLGADLFAEYYGKRIEQGDRNTLVVSPDVGGIARSRKFAKKLGLDLAIIDKRREKANQSEVMNIIGDVKGKNVILCDDIVDTAGSLCHAAEALVKNGAVSVQACVTHGVLSGPAIDRLNDSCIEKLVLIDTIPAPEQPCAKLEYLSASKMFAKAIRCVAEGLSMEQFM